MRRQLIHLSRGHRSARDLGADHVHAGLALAVNAAPQPLGPKLVVGQTARHELFGVRTEQFDVGSNRGVVLGFCLGLEVVEVFGYFSGHNYPYVYRDYYIWGSFTIRQVPARIVIDAVALRTIRWRQASH